MSSQLTTAALLRASPVETCRESGFHGNSIQSPGQGSGKVVVIATTDRGWSADISLVGVTIMAGRLFRNPRGSRTIAQIILPWR
jgi:hypothetical protein